MNTLDQSFWNWLERLLLFSLVFTLPFQDHINLGSMSLVWVLFAFLSLYVLLRRLPALNSLCFNPLSMTLFAFGLSAWIFESFHSDRRFGEVSQVFQMVVGAIMLGSAVSSRENLQWAVRGFIAMGIVFSFILLSSVYNVLAQSIAENAYMASEARALAMAGFAIKVNWNHLALLMSISSLICLHYGSQFGLRSSKGLAFVGLALFIGFSSFSLMSRTGLVTLILGTLVIMRFRKFKISHMIWAATLGVGVFAVTLPDVILKRVTAVNTNTGEKKESRMMLYSVTAKHFSDFLGYGVGVGHYWQHWATSVGLKNIIGKPVGSHNAYLQILIYWGFFPLLLFLGFLFIGFLYAKRLLNEQDPLNQIVILIALALSFSLLFRTNFFDKDLAIGTGLFLASLRLNLWSGPLFISESSLNLDLKEALR